MVITINLNNYSFEINSVESLLIEMVLQIHRRDMQKNMKEEIDTCISPSTNDLVSTATAVTTRSPDDVFKPIQDVSKEAVTADDSNSLKTNSETDDKNMNQFASVFLPMLQTFQDIMKNN